MPRGWSALALGLSMTLPLAVIPVLYQSVLRTQILPAHHWTAMLFVIPAGVGAHLVMYEIIRPRIAPTPEYKSFGSGVLLELLYSILYFSAIVLLYRVIVARTSVRELLIARTFVPAGMFFFAMTIFITSVPESKQVRTWIQVRGLVSALLMMFCFCYGMFR